jgi:SAM-dependent methyltransferase
MNKQYWEKRFRRHGSKAVGRPHNPGPGKIYQRQYRAMEKYAFLHIRTNLSNVYEYDRVLDFGCGVGRMYPLLQPVSGKVVGIDFVQEAIDLAQATYPGSTWLCRDLVSENLSKDFPDGHFDMIFACAVLQHVISYLDCWRIITELRRVCRVGGSIFLIEGKHIKPNQDHVVQRSPEHYAALFNYKLVNTWDIPMDYAPDSHQLIELERTC